jgi:uridine phosphorylase
MPIDTALPILSNKVYHSASIFTPENLLREARRQKSIPAGKVPRICVLDPDGDIVQYLIEIEQAHHQPHWACYHTEMYRFAHGDIEYGIVGNVVGTSFAVLVAEECFASGCEFLISVTSAGQITPIGQPPYFVLIDKALRDEGTSYHYLPPSVYSEINPALRDGLADALARSSLRITCGATWTTDAPFRETEAAIAHERAQGILGVEMEAAALYAFAEARSKAVVCFAHITNQMGNVENDFEKGAAQGSHDVLQVIHLTAMAWLARVGVSAS